MTVFEELKRRGLLAQLTDEEEIKELINAGKATFYIGFDPTADSLHVGHFMALCGTVAIISGEREQITQAIAYLIEKNVGVEVIKDARISE